jgi:hypothetical protein
LTSNTSEEQNVEFFVIFTKILRFCPFFCDISKNIKILQFIFKIFEIFFQFNHSFSDFQINVLRF